MISTAMDDQVGETSSQRVVAPEVGAPEARTAVQLALPMTITAAAILACFGGLAFFRYGLYDDYYNGVRPLGELMRISISAGRPVAGALQSVSFGLTDPITGFGALRLLTVALIAAQAALTTMVLARRLESVLAATLISITAHVTVGVQVVAAWGATLWVVVLASLLAAAGGYWLWIGDRDRRLVICGSAAVVVSLAIYQPAGMASLGVLGILAVTEPQPWTSVWHRLFRSGGWLGGSFAIYVVIWRACQLLVPETGARGGLTDDPLGKANWIVDSVAPRMANPFSITGFSWTTGSVVVVLVAAAPIGLDRERRALLMRSLIALTIPLVCYAPNLLVEESWASSRSLWVVLVIVAVLAGIGAYRLAEQVIRRVHLLRRVVPIFATGLVVVLAINAGDQTVDLLAEPNAAELRAVQAAASDVIDGQPPAIALIPSGWQDSIATTVSFDEFGYPASAASWAILAMIRPVLIERDYGGPVIVVDSAESDAVPPGAVILDLGEVLDRLRTD